MICYVGTLCLDTLDVGERGGALGNVEATCWDCGIVWIVGSCH